LGHAKYALKPSRTRIDSSTQGHRLRGGLGCEDEAFTVNAGVTGADGAATGP